MAGFRVLLDANVLFPIVQTDLLLQLANRDAFVPLWSSAILEEVVNSLVTTGRVTKALALTRVDMMNEAFLDAQVANWESLVYSIEGIPDPDDRHVVAAAIEGNASAIVTDNLKDFPNLALEDHGLHAKSCDDFLLDLYDLSPARFDDALDEMVKLRTRPKVSLSQLLEVLAKSCPNFVDLYRHNL